MFIYYWSWLLRLPFTTITTTTTITYAFKGVRCFTSFNKLPSSSFRQGNRLFFTNKLSYCTTDNRLIIIDKNVIMETRKRTRSSSRIAHAALAIVNDNVDSIIGNNETKMPFVSGSNNLLEQEEKQEQKTQSEQEKHTNTISTTGSRKVINNRNGILMILSPAKTLDVTDNAPPFIQSMVSTIPNCCVEKTNKIVSFMKEQSEIELIKLLSLSKPLGKKTKEYYNQYNSHQSNDDNDNDNDNDNNNTISNKTTDTNDVTTGTTYYSKQCIYMYSGAAYQGLDVSTCSKSTIQYLQNNLRILDALYGILYPLDIIQCYRLEMATKNIILDVDSNNSNSTKIKLHDYWSDDITNSLCNDLTLSSDSTSTSTSTDDTTTDNNILLNLASTEYSCAININKLPKSCHYITIVFQDNYRVVSIHAKRARGLMVRYISENNIQTLDGIQQFNVEGYSFVSYHDDNNNIINNNGPKKRSTIIFNRSKNSK